MTPGESKPIERQIREATETGDRDLATTVALREYGPEVLGWLISRFNDETRGHDAFSLFAEALWQSWDRFAWRCTARGWAYAVARNVANHHAAGVKRRARREVPMRTAEMLRELTAHLRTSTRPYLRTEVKGRVRELRRQLSEEDQTILVLRVDRRMAWADIAHALLFDGEPIDEAALARESARLRKRLQLIIARLRTLAGESGLV